MLVPQLKQTVKKKKCCVALASIGASDPVQDVKSFFCNMFVACAGASAISACVHCRACNDRRCGFDSIHRAFAHHAHWTMSWWEACRACAKQCCSTHACAMQSSIAQQCRRLQRARHQIIFSGRASSSHHHATCFEHLHMNPSLHGRKPQHSAFSATFKPKGIQTGQSCPKKVQVDACAQCGVLVCSTSLINVWTLQAWARRLRCFWVHHDISTIPLVVSFSGGLPGWSSTVLPWRKVMRLPPNDDLSSLRDAEFPVGDPIFGDAIFASEDVFPKFKLTSEIFTLSATTPTLASSSDADYDHDLLYSV